MAYEHFPQFCRLTFHFVDCFFFYAVYKLASFKKSHLFIFAFVDLFFVSDLKKNHCQGQCLEAYLLCFLFRVVWFQVLCSNLKSCLDWFFVRSYGLMYALFWRMFPVFEKNVYFTAVERILYKIRLASFGVKYSLGPMFHYWFSVWVI